MTISQTDTRAELCSAMRLDRYSRLLLDSTEEGIYGVDRNGNCTYVNRAGAAMLGYAPEEMMGRNVHALTHYRHPDGTPYPIETCPIYQVMQTGQAVRRDDEVFWRRDETGFPVEYLSSPIWEGEEIVGAGVTFTDITARRQNIQERRDDAARFRALADNIAQLAWMADPTGSIFWYNKRWFEYTGTTLEEMKGWGWQKIHDPNYVEGVTERFADHVRRGEEWEDTFPLRGADGNFRWFLSRAIPIRDEDGNITLWFGTNTDVTAQRTSEEALRASKDRFESLIKATGQIVWTNSADGRMLGEQPGWAEYTGQNEEEYQNYGWAEAIHPDDAQPTVDAWNEAVRERRMFVFEHRARRHDGIYRLFAVRAIPVTEANGTIREWVGLHTDITAKRQAEKDLIAAKEDAEAAAQAKSEFLATMSHEIRTPMNAVIGMTGLLLDTDLTPEQREFAQIVRDSGDALLTIINDILDYSKIEAGQLELEHQPFDLRECIESALDLVAIRASDKGIDLAYVIAPDTVEAVVGDVTRVRQIIVNLLSNAVKFTEQGEVVVSLSSRPLDGRQELHFAVRDTGIGIPPERMSRLFRSFSQVDASTTRRFGGTGLGLAISKRLTEIIGGRIWAESEVGKGSTFHVTLNMDASAHPVRTPLQIEQPHLEGKRVLIVDDNATNRQILVLQTKSWGMIPFESADGTDALAKVRQHMPLDIAILDIQMPDMDGLTLAHKMREICSPQELPIVGLSSVGPKLAEIAAAGFSAMLTKPIKQSQLYNVLAEMFTAQARTEKPDTSAPTYDATLGQRLPLRILMAEDLTVNQKLLQSLLHKFGYRADVAGNGLEVLTTLERQTFDVILMDVQMPEMDGLEASRRIGKRYGNENRPRIVALTANAMKEDQDTCRAAGMDDYLSKPINPRALEAALTRCGEWVQQRKADRLIRASQSVGGTPTLDVSKEADSNTVSNITSADEENSMNNLTEAGGKPSDTPTPVNTEPFADEPTMDPAMLADYADMPDVMAELLEAFRNDAIPMLAEMQEAVKTENAGMLRHAAHGLKGASANLGGRRLAALCGEPEAMGRQGTTQGTEPFLPLIRAEFERFCAVMAQGTS